MKKFRLFLVISLLGILLCSCGEKEAPSNVGETAEKVQTAEASGTILEAVRDEIIKELDIEDAMLIETESLNSLYGIEQSGVKNSACFVTMSGTFPHEIIMVEAADEGAVEKIADALEKKLSEVLVQSRSYDAENYELAQQCRVFAKGNYVTLFLSPDHARMQTVLEKYI